MCFAGVLRAADYSADYCCCRTMPSVAVRDGEFFRLFPPSSCLSFVSFVNADVGGFWTPSFLRYWKQLVFVHAVVVSKRVMPQLLLRGVYGCAPWGVDGTRTCSPLSLPSCTAVHSYVSFLANHLTFAQPPTYAIPQQHMGGNDTPVRYRPFAFGGLLLSV